MRHLVPGYLPWIRDDTKKRISGFSQLETRSMYGAGDTENAIIDLRDVGKFVVRIIVDERTLNKYVFVYAAVN